MPPEARMWPPAPTARARPGREWVFLTGDRREELPSVDSVLELDNTRKHKIQRLVTFSSASSPGSAKPDHEVQVDFGGSSSLPRKFGHCYQSCFHRRPKGIRELE